MSRHPSSPSIAIIGPGAIGGSLAAHLAAVHADQLTLCVRTLFDELQVIMPDGETLRSSPAMLTDPAAATPVDWVLVCTKAYDVAGTMSWLPNLVGPNTRVAIVQNGVEHVTRFQDHLDPARLLPVMVDLPAERSAPGRISQRGPGLMRMPDNAMGTAFAALFANTVLDVRPTGDFVSTMWRKLAINAPGAVNALTLKPAGIVREPAVAALMRDIIAEVIAVARAEGAELDDSLVEKVMDAQRAAPPDSVNSLHADRLAGRTMEADARNGAVVRAGLRHGIPTPLNAMAVTLLGTQQP